MYRYIIIITIENNSSKVGYTYYNNINNTNISNVLHKIIIL